MSKVRLIGDVHHGGGIPKPRDRVRPSPDVIPIALVVLAPVSFLAHKRALWVARRHYFLWGSLADSVVTVATALAWVLS